MMFNPAAALQRQGPFARHFFISSAAVADRDLGSGDACCYVQEPWNIFFNLPMGDSQHFFCPMEPLQDGTIRYGEARHPGPSLGEQLTVGVSNPGGLRQKEDVLLGMGPGIWAMAETQLSATTFKTCSGTLRASGRALNRDVRLHGGAPAPLRTGSTWAGKWTGVAVLSDFPTATLDVPWPSEHWDSGRVLMTRHWVNNLPVNLGTIYGYAQGPTWPRAQQLTDQLLETFTVEMVLGMSGVRILAGDFNQEPGQLVQQQIWMRHGWREAQQVAEELFHHQLVPTCKKATHRDQLWLSPEAIQLMRGIQVEDDFVDHSTVSIQLQIPGQDEYVYAWPRPSELPWGDLGTSTWSPRCDHSFEATGDPTRFLQSWAQDFEAAVFDLSGSTDGPFVPNRCRGRAQRLKPVKRPLATPVCKPSREGEVKMANSMAGTATRIWFRQLRRLQSMKHAVAAAKATPSAVSYRLELWEAIKSSTGFSPDFCTWWSQQQHEVDGVPQFLPASVPNESAITEAMYDSFLLHFRRFENWHLNQRSQSLKMKYAGSMKALFQDLRDDSRPGITTFWQDRHYTILAVDEQGQQIHLDQHVQDQHDSVWSHDHHFLSITGALGDICTVSSPHELAPGDQLTQRSFVTQTNDILQALTDHWKPRWNNMASLHDDDWQRVVGFAQHYMPQMHFSWEELHPQTWRSMVNKFKATAARGPDGFSKADLQHMPDAFLDALLGLLHIVETTDADWPAQLTFGTVLGLSKVDDAHEVHHFRPITLFSTIYRTWSRLRTRQMVRQLAQYMPAEALGFLPHRETTEVWLQLQASIEMMLQSQHDFSGLSTDLKRAFNHIGRKQVFHVAQHLGFPWQLLNSWNKFLNQCTRCFEVHGCLGEPVQSQSGFPEGCPLSILAMLSVNWCYHIYMKAFCPSVTTYSFVDNLTLAAREAFEVARAYFALRTICQLFGLSTDDDKTYVWGLTRESRAALGLLGFPCVSDASELGGAMTFGASRRTRVLRRRGHKLFGKWQRLKKSLAPGPQKLASLPTVFWPQAFHGSSGCLIADNYATSLRKEAVKALKLNGAGSNPMLRLTLSGNMQADPGFFQIQLCFAVFRRMLRKQTDLLPMWKIWHDAFDGRCFPGPFSRLAHCFSTLGWHVTRPPFVMDHEGHSWNFQWVDAKTLSTLLEDAWLQYVASQVKHKTMDGLQGLDGFLTQLDFKQMNSLERARVSALHSGAFMTNYEQAKFDPEKTPMCPLCNCEDDRRHWLLCPRFQHFRHQITGWQSDNLELPHCVLHHLLVPRQQCLVEWRAQFCQPEGDGNVFLVAPPKHGFLHLFIDGSCFSHTYPMLNVAAWGVVDATNQQAVAASVLTGITQTIDRAELSALVAASTWPQNSEVGLCIWSDSLSTIQVAEQLMREMQLPDHLENSDLWLEVLELLQGRTGLETEFRWIPSHLPREAGEDPFEDWVIRWNDAADRLTCFTNRNRTASFWRRRCQINAVLDGWVRRLRELRQFYMLVAEADKPEISMPDIVQVMDSSDEEPDWLWVPWSDNLPLNWKVQCLHGNFQLPGQFLVDVITWICATESLTGIVRQVSDVEFVFLLLLDTDFSFPFKLDGSQQMFLRRPDSLFQRPTFAMLLRPVQTALATLHEIFPQVVHRTPPRPNIELGLYMSFSGLRISVPDWMWQAALTNLRSFTATRAVRHSRDLARPVP